MSKEIIAVLIKNDNNENVIRFKIDTEELDLNLESNNSEEIKKIFLRIAEQLRYSPVKIEYSVDNSIDAKEDALFIDAAFEYVEQLKQEILTVETDGDLKEIRISLSSTE